MDRILELGIRVTTQTGLNYNLGGTDANTGPMSPFVAMWTDVTRQTRVGVIGKTQAVTPLEPLKMHTIWAAEVMGDGAIKGTIEPGKLADLAVLDRNPLAIDEDEIKEIQATMTIVDGKIVFER